MSQEHRRAGSEWPHHTVYHGLSPKPPWRTENAASGLVVTPRLSGPGPGAGGQRRHLFLGTFQEGLAGHCVEEAVSSCCVRVPGRPRDSGLRCTEAWGGDSGLPTAGGSGEGGC